MGYSISEEQADDMYKEMQQEGPKALNLAPMPVLVFDIHTRLITASQHSRKPNERKALLLEEIAAMEALLAELRGKMDILSKGEVPRNLKGLRKANWQAVADEHGHIMINLMIARKLLLTWVNIC